MTRTLAQPEKPVDEVLGSHAQSTEPGRPKRLAVALAQFCGLLAILWCCFFALYTALPYVRSGAEIIYQAKAKLLSRGLDSDLVIFGNSKVLSGFRPASFDSLAGLRSFNLGLPDEERFIGNLETIAQRGKSPRVVLLTLTQSASEQPFSLFRYLEHDRAIVDRLFPFRLFPRDLTLFLLRSRSRGGPAAFYRQSEGIVSRMETDRGYYFIEAQAYGANHQLPSEFHLPSDRPEFVKARGRLNARDLARLHSIAARYNMQIWFVPTYYRPGEYAAAPPGNALIEKMVRDEPRIHLIGPDYWILPLECFSDAAHLNPAGADIYTRRLADLLAPVIR